MLEVRNAFRKLISQRNFKGLELRKISLPLLGKISGGLLSYRSQNSDASNWPKFSNNNIVTVHCIRHAESTVNALINHHLETLNIQKLLYKKDPGILDAPLSRNGAEKASYFGDKGGPLYLGKPIMERSSLILTSNLKRAMETANIISKRSPKDCKICVLDFVREKALYESDIPSSSVEEIISNYPRADVTFLSHANFKETIVLPESLDQLDLRIQQFLNFIQNYEDFENNEVVLVSHFYFLKRLLKGSVLWNLPNLGVITIQIDKRTGRILGSSTHR
ncbi:hypothetical protein OJ253_3268 [Cryptosporidium canis]|uniref:Phosphoglycerate mutase family protein n=1 Tax=Cryptosporidium canis TaxID=195482 RepID=A0A9D5DE67_9CRYT|nr:hypothetical protein OJ253_3268 [Cryptosporidium canis]